MTTSVTINFDKPKQKRQKKVWLMEAEAKQLVGRYFANGNCVGYIAGVSHERDKSYATLKFVNIVTGVHDHGDCCSYREGEAYIRNSHICTLYPVNDFLRTNLKEVSKEDYDKVVSIIADAKDKIEMYLYSITKGE